MRRVSPLPPSFLPYFHGISLNPWHPSFLLSLPRDMTLLQAMITGPQGTPYSGGCFVFDIYFPSDYPNEPPKVNMQTTGNGQVRFNPNLYNCGKVCLSLLGTWSGEVGENWNSKTSTLLQVNQIHLFLCSVNFLVSHISFTFPSFISFHFSKVLISIQSLIMVEQPFFNEPGFERTMGTREGDVNNFAYNAYVRLATVKHAMIDALKSPSKPFEDVIKKHFFLQRDVIKEQCQQWLLDAEKYTTPVNNYVSSYTKERYVAALKEAVRDLETELDALKG